MPVTGISRGARRRRNDSAQTVQPAEWCYGLPFQLRITVIDDGSTASVTASTIQKVFDGKVVLERDPVILKVANTWLILNAGGGPTDDKPTVTLETPKDPNRASAFMNIRVADIKKA